MNTQGLSIFVIVIGVYALYLQSQGRLLNVIDNLLGITLPEPGAAKVGQTTGSGVPSVPKVPALPAPYKITPLPPIGTANQAAQGWKQTQNKDGVITWTKQ